MSDSERAGEIGAPKEISHTGVEKEELSETDETRLSDKDSAPSNGVENQMSNVISVGEKDSAQPDGIENHTTSQSDVIGNHTTALNSIQENDMAQSDDIENPLITVNASPEKHSSQSGDLENHITGVHSYPEKDSVHPNGNNNNMSALNLTAERNTAHSENEGPRSSDGGIMGDEGDTETGDLKKGEGSGNLPVESDSLVNDEELLEAGTEGKISRESQNGVIEKELDPETEMHLVTLDNGDMRIETEDEENDNTSSSEESGMELCHEDDLMEEVDDGTQNVEIRRQELVSMVTGSDLPSDNELIEEEDNTVSRMAMLDDNNIKEEQLQPPAFSEGNAVEVKRPINLFLLGPDATEDEETGTPEEQLAFMKELETFHKEKFLEFKPPRFYGEPLNCLKLFRAVVRLGGYEQVTSCKYWRQVGESFKPPKTCTTVSWTFRCFYEKALLEYEKHKMHCGELPFSDASVTEQTSCGNQPGVHPTLGSGRTRRDAAARAMQGWHSQRNLGNGEVGDAIIKDKNSTSTPKREKTLKSIPMTGLLKRKRPSPVDRAVKVAHLKVSKTQESDTMVVDVGPPADWVKINVQRTKDCFELYALVPGLLREEVRVQSDPAGRLVITGEPGQLDNPWGVTAFKKVVTLPSRIDPHQTSAVVTLHGQLFVRIPFEQSDM